MITKARPFLEKLKVNHIVELCDQCIDLCAEHADLLDDTKNDVLKRFQLFTQKAKKESPVALICNLIGTAAPHSMVVERTVSHYNLFRSQHRMSMSLQAANNRLLIALNGCGTASFDPRPAIAEFLIRKERRTRIPAFTDYKNRPFMAKFFRDSGIF